MTASDVLHAEPPRLTVAHAEELSRTIFGVQGTARPLVSERDQNFAIDAHDGQGWVLKVSNPAEDPEVVEMEVAAVERIAALDPGLPVPRPRPALNGRPIARFEVDGAAQIVRLLPLLPGRNARPEELDDQIVRQLGEVVARIGLALRAFFHPAAGRVILWDQQRLPLLFEHVALIAPGPRQELAKRMIRRLSERVLPALPRLRSQVIHNDVTLDNLLLDERGQVTGIIDFGDMAHTALVLDIPATLQSLVRERADILEVAEPLIRGYASILPLETTEAELLGDLLAGRMVQTILISSFRTRRYPDNAYIHGWSEPAWALLEELDRLGLDEVSRQLAAMARRPVASRRPTDPHAADALLARRRRILGDALEPLSYRRPLHLVYGDGAWMEDGDGRRYLDAYNNVPVVGHSHPAVVEAISRQAATLNTNTRYLHENVIELGERLVASMPDGLDTVMFVNSGSEANDLAWRLATTVSGGDAGLVTEWAYHGVTAAIADLSPSEWPRGGQSETVETFGAPDTYRGPYAEQDSRQVARAEIDGAVSRLAARGRQPAAIYLDSLFTSDGIFVPPSGVVTAIVAGAREAGALYVADEVQCGHGRTGDDMWGFRAWDVTPDIVTLGKPMGNGHPVAALVTRAEIVDRFAAATTFFSTFGGNPVACAAALAVLDVLDEEGLVERAAEIGTRLRSALAELAQRHPAVGDVRGRGLMAGVELVGDRATREPAPGLASAVKDEMRERGVLIGTTGKSGNILKIRPPLCLQPREADLIVSCLDETLTALGA
jgi:4-aminobutyrate aminotransferase-like enzyme/Ser/Thr protein kinase RdoA (MazF antagonist)